MSIQEARRAKFDLYYAEYTKEWPPGLASIAITRKTVEDIWNAALDSVCIQLPRPATQKGREYVEATGHFIAAQGFEVKK